ncbi:hypothetical protein AVDCRST_MAG94-280, partial [uncultured Leptolyngbya sp.]
ARLPTLWTQWNRSVTSNTKHQC